MHNQISQNNLLVLSNMKLLSLKEVMLEIKVNY